MFPKFKGIRIAHEKDRPSIFELKNKNNIPIYLQLCLTWKKISLLRWASLKCHTRLKVPIIWIIFFVRGLGNEDWGETHPFVKYHISHVTHCIPKIAYHTLNITYESRCIIYYPPCVILKTHHISDYVTLCHNILLHHISLVMYPIIIYHESYI